MMSLRRLGLSLALLASVLALPASATAAEPAPAWSLKASSYPTNFVQGTIGSSLTPPGYLLTATNLGGAPTAGTFTVSDTLPSGIVPQAVTGRSGKKQVPMLCSISGQKVTCHWERAAPGRGTGGSSDCRKGRDQRIRQQRSDDKRRRGGCSQHGDGNRRHYPTSLVRALGRRRGFLHGRHQHRRLGDDDGRLSSRPA